MKTIAKKIYLALICIILYAPIVTLIVLSFNNTKTRSKWGGFTGKWYVSLFQNKEIMNALYTTLIIALLSALIAQLLKLTVYPRLPWLYVVDDQYSPFKPYSL